MFQPKIPMIVLFFLLIFNAIPMIFSPVEFDKDYIENGMKVPSTQEGSVYEGLAARNKAGLGAALWQVLQLQKRTLYYFLSDKFPN